MNRVELHITGEGEKRLKSYPLKDLGWDCEHPELKFNLQADSSERGGWDFGVFTWITITDPQGNTIHKSGAKTTSGKGRRSSLVSFKFNPGKYSLSELTLNVYGYKCGTSKDVDHHFRTCWGKAKASDNIRLEYLGVETVNSLGWSNPSYDKDQHDTWGLFWTQGGPLDHNGPNAFGSKFSPEGFGLADAWVLKTLRVASGANISWEYEVDDWFTSRGDVFQPLYGKYLNYYAYMRNKAQPDDTLCQNNYGGGLKVTSETKCDGVSSCIKTNYDYSVYDPSLKCFRSAGAIDTVPYAPPSTYNDYDIRRPGHMGSEYGVGSVFYNQVKVMPVDQDTYQAFKYFTVDSTPESTDGATDVNMMDDFGGNTPHDFDELGSSANTPQPWKRGQEYWIGYYSTNPALGRNGLLREVKRSFTSHEHIKYFFQDVKLIAVHPLKIVQEEIDFPDAEYDGKRYGKFYGASSGTMRVSNTSMILYDPGAGEQFQIDNFFEYDPYSGQPNKITLVSDDITKVMTIKYAFETNPILLARHILSPVYETTSYEDEEAPGNALISKQIIYKNFAD